jgi:hypothetical protein
MKSLNNSPWKGLYLSMIQVSEKRVSSRASAGNLLLTILLTSIGSLARFAGIARQFLRTFSSFW